MPITGVYETYEGLAHFETFDDYLRHWIRPNLLKDLETVFEGAKGHWNAQKNPPGSPGRGDFVMATALLSIFDHFGAFLARPKIDWIMPAENIARLARRLAPSLADIYAILAKMGRNALTHGAWPQTAIVVDAKDKASGLTEPWAFGLSFNANDDPKRHDTFHWKPYVLRPGVDPPERVPAKTIKLVLNVHNLRALMVRAIDEGVLFEGVTKLQFERVRKIARLMGDTREASEAELKKCAKPGHWDKARVKKVSRYWLCKEGTLQRQIENLIAEAKRLRVPWSKEDEKTPRDYGGHKGPSDANPPQ